MLATGTGIAPMRATTRARIVSIRCDVQESWL